MAKSIVNPRKKIGRPSVDSEQVNLRLSREVLDGLDKFIAETPEYPTRTKAVRYLLKDTLVGLNCIPFVEDEE